MSDDSVWFALSAAALAQFAGSYWTNRAASDSDRAEEDAVRSLRDSRNNDLRRGMARAIRLGLTKARQHPNAPPAATVDTWDFWLKQCESGGPELDIYFPPELADFHFDALNPEDAVGTDDVRALATLLCRAGNDQGRFDHLEPTDLELDFSRHLLPEYQQAFAHAAVHDGPDLAFFFRLFASKV